MAQLLPEGPIWSQAAPPLPASSSEASGSKVPISSIASSGDPGEGRGTTVEECARMPDLLVINAMTVP